MKDILIVGLVGLLWELVSSDGGELITIVLFALLVGTAIARTPRARDVVVICGVGPSWQTMLASQLHCSDQVPCTCCHRRWDPDAGVLAAGWRAAITMTGDGAASHGNGAGEPRRCSRPSRPSIGSRSTNGSMPGRHAVTFRPTGKTGNRNLRKSAAVLLAGARRVGEYEPASIGGSGVWFRAVPSAVALRALADGSAAHTI